MNYGLKEVMPSPPERQHHKTVAEFAPYEASEGYELPVNVVVTDPLGDAVFKARISMWISPKPVREPR